MVGVVVTEEGEVSFTGEMDTRPVGEMTVTGSGMGHGGERPCWGKEMG